MILKISLQKHLIKTYIKNKDIYNIVYLIYGCTLSVNICYMMLTIIYTTMHYGYMSTL
jgi:hypothetical protein